MNVQSLTNTHFTVKVVYTYKAFQSFSELVFEHQPFLILFWKAHNGRRFYYSSLFLSLLFSGDTQPFTETLAGPSTGSLRSVFVKEPLFSWVLDAGIVLIQTNTVCRTNIFVLLNPIMHGVAK